MKNEKSGSNNNNNQAFIMAGGQMEQPKGLLDALSEIEFVAAQERKGAALDADFLTTKTRLDFAELGFRSTFLSGIVASLFVPIAIGVIEKNIPVFGATNPNLFDQIFVLVVSSSYMIGYAIFIGMACSRHHKEYSRQMASNLLSGVTLATIIKAGLMFIFFNFLYLVIFTKTRLYQIFSWINQNATFLLSESAVQNSYKWCVEFRDAFLWSAWYVLITSTLYVLYIQGSYMLAKRRNKKLLEAT